MKVQYETYSLSKARPRPSLLMRMPAAANRLVKAKLVNWLPGSVLKISAWPRASAASKHSWQHVPSNVFDKRKANTLRLYPSMTATR